MRAHRLIQSFAVAAVVVSGLPAVALSSAEASTGATVSEMRGSELRLRGRLRATGVRMSGNADYRERDRGSMLEIRFKVEVERAQPDTAYAIFVDGKEVGTLTTNGFGWGKKQFRTLSDDPDHDPNVPQVHAGSVVTIGKISGTMG